MSAGTLVAWRKQPGDRVHRGDIIAEVETDKGLIEVEVFASGVIEQLLVEPGDEGAVGTGAGHHPRGGGRGCPPRRRRAPSRRAGRPAPRRDAIAAGASRRSAASRRRARRRPAAVRGTGPGGAISLEDVERAAAARPAAPAAARPRAEADRQARMRQAIAAAMARSKREIPHYYLARPIDMHRAMTWLAEENAQRPVHRAPAPRGAADQGRRPRPARGARAERGVARAPELVRSEAVHVGVAISLRGGGLVAPALHDADRQDLGELMRNFRDLVQRARAGDVPQLRAVRPDDHGHEPRRAGRRDGVRRDLSAAGGDRRASARSSSGPGSSTGAVVSRPRGDRHAVGRPPRQRRPPRRPLPGRRRPPAAGARAGYDPGTRSGPPSCAYSARSRPRPILARSSPTSSCASSSTSIRWTCSTSWSGLHEALHVDIPEADYPKFATLHDCIEQLASRTSS